MNRTDLISIAAIAGGKKILSIAPTQEVTSKGGRGNFVTAADLASEQEIVHVIQKHYPKDVILSEESKVKPGDLLELNNLWVIDPLDGTNNFRGNRYYSGVSVAFIERGVVKAGAIYNPFRDELFHTQKGSGAFLKNKRITVGNQTSLAHASIDTDNSYEPSGTEHNLKLALKLRPLPWILMRGSAVLTLAGIADGRTDAFFHTAFKPWDIAAGFLLVEEAGGVIKGIDGSEVDWQTTSAVIGNKSLVDQIVKKFTQN